MRLGLRPPSQTRNEHMNLEGPILLTHPHAIDFRFTSSSTIVRVLEPTFGQPFSSRLVFAKLAFSVVMQCFGARGVSAFQILDFHLCCIFIWCYYGCRELSDLK